MPFAAGSMPHPSFRGGRAPDFAGTWQPERDHVILSFYSYKGGVGRTSLALDTAARVALGSATRPPLRVLVWDLDLDAPGIAHFPALREMAERASYGTHDLLALLDPGATPTAGPPEVDEREVLAILRNSILTDPDVAEGRLSLLLPDGKLSSPPRQSQPDVAPLFGPGGSGPSLLVLAAELARRELEFDVIVIDARTGINDLSATATTVLADCAVLVFRLDGQDLAHLSEIVDAIHYSWDLPGAGASDMPNRLYRVANLVPDGDEDLRDAVVARRRELAEMRLEPHLELALRPLALVRESTPSLDGPALGGDAELKLEQLAEWVYQRWADLARRSGLPSRKPDRGTRSTTVAKRLEDQVAALLRLGGWRVSGSPEEGRGPIDLRAEKTGEFGREQVLMVSCKASRSGASPQDVERLSDFARVLAPGAHAEAMLVTRRISASARDAAVIRDVILVTPEDLLDQQAPSAPLRSRARELWEGTALERHYVAPTAVVLDVEGAPTGEEAALDDYALGWLERTKAGLLCVLGDFGAGKTTFCQRLGAILVERPGAPLPLFVDLRTAGSTALTIDGLLRHALDQAKLDQSRLEPWRFRLQEGSLVLLVDGFDELLGYSDPSRMESLLEELQQAASSGRVILTSRSSYFRSDRDAALALRGGRASGSRTGTALWNQLKSRGDVTVAVLEVQPFTDEQVQLYLTLRFGVGRLQAILLRLRALHPVDDLLRRPYLLTLVATSIDQWEARGWPTRLTLTSVYESYVSDWLARDQHRHSGLPAEPASLAQHLARVLWDRTDAHILSRELRREAAAWGASVSGRMISAEEEETIEAKVRTALFLVRDERGAYRFAHRSFLEFFVAKDIAETLAGAPTPDEARAALDLARLTPEIATFLAGWPESWSALPEICRGILETAPSHPRASTNALLLMIWHGRSQHRAGASEPAPVIVDEAQLAGVDLGRADLAAVSLRRSDLAGADLAGATLSRANLSEASLIGADAAQADFTDADLSRAKLDRAILSGTSLDGADLEYAELLGCDLRRASLRGARIARSCFAYALLSQADLTRADATQTDLTHARLAGATVNDVDLSSARLGHTDLRFASLRGSALPADTTSTNTYGARHSPEPAEITGAGVSHIGLRKPQALCLVPQGDTSHIAVGCSDGVLRMWDPDDGAMRVAHRVHSEPVRVLCVQGRRASPSLVSCGDDGMLVSWQVGREQPLVVYRGSEDPILAMCGLGHSDELPMVAFGDGSRVCIWDLREPGSHRTLVDQDAPLTAMCALRSSGGRRLLASAGEDLTIRLWDLDTGLLRAELAGHTEWIRALCEVTLADGTPGLASAGDDETIRLWDIERGLCVAELTGHTDWIYSLCTLTLADGSPGLASAGDDEVVRVWSIGAREQVAILTGHTNWVRSVCTATLMDGTTWLASTGEDETIRIWDASSEELLTTIDGKTAEIESISVASLAGDAGGIAMANGDGGLRVWDPDSGELVQVLVGTGEILASCRFALADGSIGVAVGGHQSVRIWNTREGTSSVAVAHRCEWLNALVQVDRGDGTPLIAAAGDDGLIRMFEPYLGEQLGELGGREDAIVALAQMAGPGAAQMLASADNGGNVIVYEIGEGGVARHLGTHDVGATSLCPLIDDRDGAPALASADRDGVIRVWSLTGGQIDESWHPGGPVSAICAFRPDGRSTVLVSAGGDGALRIWELGHTEPRETIHSHAGAALAVSPVLLSNDVQGLASAGIDGSLCIHRAGEDACLTLVALEESTDWLAYRRHARLLAGSLAAWGTESALSRLLLVGARWNAVDVRLTFPGALRFLEPPDLTLA
jgi:WD40 repeat protein